jgi:hypothetical protein
MWTPFLMQSWAIPRERCCWERGAVLGGGEMRHKYGDGDPKRGPLRAQRVFFFNFSPKERQEVRRRRGMWQQAVRVTGLSLPLETAKTSARSFLLSEALTLRASTCSERRRSLILLNHAKLIWGERLPSHRSAEKRIGEHMIYRYWELVICPRVWEKWDRGWGPVCKRSKLF